MVLTASMADDNGQPDLPRSDAASGSETGQLVHAATFSRLRAFHSNSAVEHLGHFRPRPSAEAGSDYSLVHGG